MKNNEEYTSYTEMTSNYDVDNITLRQNQAVRYSSNSKIQDISSLVQANSAIINKTLDLASQITDVYAESQRLNAKVEMVKEWSKVEIAKTAAKYLTTKDIIEKTFSERSQVLGKHYRVLEEGLQSGDKDLILAAMHEISSIVTTSPLADIQNFIKRFEDKSVTLLDF